MALWKRKPASMQAKAKDSGSEILFLGDDGNDGDDTAALPNVELADVTQTVLPEEVSTKVSPGVSNSHLFPNSRSSVDPLAESMAKETTAPQVELSVETLHGDTADTLAPVLDEVIPAEGLTPLTAERRKKRKFSFKDLRRSIDAKGTPDEPGYIPDWRRGAKGRPSQLFVGFLPDVTKKDAISFALGIAQRHGINTVNCAYAVYKHGIGWAYEVHEGGPRRAYLPKILKEFEQQTGGPLTENSLVTIETAQRRVRVERTQTGLTAFWMPEGFSDPQTTWLEPGPKLKPAATLLHGIIWFGGTLFATGFLTLVVAFLTRPEPPPLNASARVAIPYALLPSSQWQGLLAVYGDGYMVDSLKWTRGKWVINRTKPGEGPSVAPPANTPATPQSKSKP